MLKPFALTYACADAWPIHAYVMGWCMCRYVYGMDVMGASILLLLICMALNENSHRKLRGLGFELHLRSFVHGSCSFIARTERVHPQLPCLVETCVQLLARAPIRICVIVIQDPTEKLYRILPICPRPSLMGMPHQIDVIRGHQEHAQPSELQKIEETFVPL
jgi:hypothetical protein